MENGERQKTLPVRCGGSRGVLIYLKVSMKMAKLCFMSISLPSPARDFSPHRRRDRIERGCASHGYSSCYRSHICMKRFLTAIVALDESATCRQPADRGIKENVKYVVKYDVG